MSKVERGIQGRERFKREMRGAWGMERLEKDPTKMKHPEMLYGNL